MKFNQYILNSKDFAQPILLYLQSVVHKACKDLASEKILLQYIKEAMRLIDEGKTLPKKSGTKAEPLLIPTEITKALSKNLPAKTFFKSLSASQQREYVQWYTEAKQETTKQRRLVQMIEWLSESKTRNWKYEK